VKKGGYRLFIGGGLKKKLFVAVDFVLAAGFALVPTSVRLTATVPMAAGDAKILDLPENCLAEHRPPGSLHR